MKADNLLNKGNHRPEITVVMSVFNLSDKKILGESIGSVLKQTYSDFEFIICDDGSTDQTWNLLKKMAQADKRMKIIHSRINRKSGYARNLCIKKARGRYIAIMDADDISAPERLEKQHRFLAGHPEYALVGCRSEYFINRIGDDGENYWYCRRPEPKDFLFSLPFVHASVMFRKETLETVHGYAVSHKTVRVEDYDLMLRIYGAGMRGYNLDEVLYYYRRDEGQYRRRKYRYRFCEAYIRYHGFRRLGLMPGAVLYVLKPLVVGLIPIRFMKVVQKRYYTLKASCK